MNDESEALCLAATWKNDGTMEQDHTFETGIGTIWRLIKAWEGYTATTTPRPGKGNAQHIFGSCIFSITGTSPIISVTSWCLLGTHGPKGVSYSQASELLFKDHPTKQNCLKPWFVSPLSGGCPTCQRVKTKWMISIRFISLSMMGAVVSHQ